MGAARKSAIITDEDKLATAYHEGGHAVRPNPLSSLPSLTWLLSIVGGHVHSWCIPRSIRHCRTPRERTGIHSHGTRDGQDFSLSR